jgi:hypothetical protein
MSAESYNKKQMESGAFTDAMVVRLVTKWQKGVSLEADGYCGPATQATLIKANAGKNPASSELGLLALSIAVDNIGNGEEGGNNSGPFVEKLHLKVWDGNDDDDGAWCGAFVSWCFEEACRRLDIDMPFKRSGGAKRLWRNIKEAGSEPLEPAPGDVVCWDRGKRGSWAGHTGFVESYSGGVLNTVEGNVGAYPSRVRRFMHDLSRQDRLEGFARAPRT